MPLNIFYIKQTALDLFQIKTIDGIIDGLSISGCPQYNLLRVRVIGQFVIIQ
jgi:hypothetical protein